MTSPCHLSFFDNMAAQIRERRRGGREKERTSSFWSFITTADGYNIHDSALNIPSLSVIGPWGKECSQAEGFIGVNPELSLELKKISGKLSKSI